MKASYAMRKTFALDDRKGSRRSPPPRLLPGGPGPSCKAGVVDAAKAPSDPAQDNGPGAYRCSANAEAVDRKEP